MKSIVRKVRSKSPFRRRKRADEWVAEIREKEMDYANNLNSKYPSLRNQENAIVSPEIEVVLETTKPGKKQQYSREDGAVPDLITSSVSTDEATGPQEASKKFMEKQQKAANGNRRKSFRDRFMRPYKKPALPPSPPSAPKTSKHRGVVSARAKLTKEPVKKVKQERGRSPARNSDHEPAQGRAKPKPQGRGRSHTRDNKARGGGDNFLYNGEERKSISSRGGVEPLLDQDNEGRVIPENETDRNLKHQPISIELGQMSRVSELSSPAAIIRQESLGNESIRGVREALQKMELELERASAGGKRISRDKIMNALNFMANSLHHEEQKRALAKELDAWIDESVVGAHNPGVRVDIDDEDDYSDGDTLSSGDCSSTFDVDGLDDDATRLSTLKQQQQINLSFQDLMGRLGKFFTVTEEHQSAVQTALSDLLWRELMWEKNGQSGVNQCLRKIEEENGSSDGESDSEVTEDDLPTFDPLTCDLNYSKKQPKRGRSWWRKYGGGKKGTLLLEMAPSSDKSNLSDPTPTTKGNRRKLSEGSKAKSEKSKAKATGSTGSRKSKQSPGALPQQPSTSMKRRGNSATRFAMDESDKESVGFGSVEGSEFWRHGDRYAAPNGPNTITPQTNYAGNYKLAYSSPARRPDFEEEFLKSPDGDEDDFDDWDDSCLHSAENLSSPQMAT